MVYLRAKSGEGRVERGEWVDFGFRIANFEFERAAV
jgi:hypothetical protein